METIRRPSVGAPDSDAFGVSAPGVKRLHSAPRHGLLRSWGLLLVAIVLGLLIALLGYDRPSPVGIGDPAVASGPVPVANGQSANADPSGVGGAGADPDPIDAEASSSAGAVVHVVGEVATPGVLTLPVGARVADAVTAAGGALPGADLSGVNLARRVNDGEQIVVGLAGESPGATGGTTPAAAPAPPTGAGAGLVNLNRATSQDLQELPRVGPVTAEKILAYRDKHGPFTSIEQLLEVPGIGEGTLAGLRDQVTV